MLFSLGVSEIAALIGVQSQTKSAFVCADVISHEVGIFGDIDGFEGQFAKSLSPFDVGVFVAGNSDVSDSGSGPVLSINHKIIRVRLKRRSQKDMNSR